MIFKVDLNKRTVSYQSRVAAEWLKADILSTTSSNDYFSNRTRSDGNTSQSADPLLTVFAKAGEEDEVFDTLVINSTASFDWSTKKTFIQSSVILTVHNESDGTPGTPSVYNSCTTELN